MLAADATPHHAQSSRAILLAIDERIVITAILLIGFALRLAIFDLFAFHPDEAIYSFWALYGRHVDPLFLQVWPDKPPLFLWVLGGAFDLLGTTPLAARVPNLLFSTLSIAVVAALAQHWWGGRAGLVAGLLMALNPFAISFAPTAFTDPLMVLAGLLAIYAAARQHPVWAGAWLGIAMMTKQQGLLFAPLVLAFLFQPPLAGRRTGQHALLVLVGLLLIAAPVLYWDSLRWAVAPSPWDLGARNAAGAALSNLETWPARLADWLALSRHLLGDPLTWLLLCAAVLATRGCNGDRPRGTVLPTRILVVWGAAYLTLHIVSTVQVWDRYLLPLAPVVALFGGFCADWIIRSSAIRRTEAAGDFARNSSPMVRIFANRSPIAGLFLIAWLLLQTGPAVQAAQGKLALGGDRGAYTGIDEATAWLEAHAETLPVVYHRSAGWHLQFHLFAPLQTGQIDLRWAPSAVQLADNAAKTPHRPRYLVETDWSPERDLSLQLAARKLTAEPRLHIGRFTIYEITDQPPTATDWRACRLATLPGVGWSVLASDLDGSVQSCTDISQATAP
jgi:hypothetical protein